MIGACNGIEVPGCTASEAPTTHALRRPATPLSAAIGKATYLKQEKDEQWTAAKIQDADAEFQLLLADLTAFNKEIL